MKKSEILLNHIDTFYKTPEHRETLVDILNKSGGISLRNLEWFITNYSKRNAYQQSHTPGKSNQYQL